MQGDIAAYIRGELALWRDVWKERHSNLVLLLLRRRSRGYAPSLAPRRLLSLLPYLFTCLVSFGFTRWLLGQQPLGPQQETAYTLTLVLLAIGIHWLFTTLYSVARSGLALLAEPGALGRSELSLAPAELIQMDARSILFGLVWTLLPQLWRGLAIAPLIGWGALTWSNSVRTLLHGDNPGVIQGALAAPGLAGSWLWLALFAIPGSFVFILWLVVMGRGLRTLWQFHALSLVAAATQLIWLPLAFHNKVSWAGLTGDRGDDASFAPFFMLLLAMALFLSVMLISRRRPSARMVFSLCIPLLAVVFSILTYTVWTNMLQAESVMRTYKLHVWMANLMWALSAFAVVNPLVLPAFTFPETMSFDPAIFLSFSWFRTPGILALQLFYGVILLYVALQAVEDWRREED